jgi:LytS/YehU family sensor histidine kinase
MILKLSELLRYVIYSNDKNEVLLEVEILYIEKAIEMFRMRTEGELNIGLYTKGRIQGRTIPPLLLISMIEDCFNHSDFETNDQAFMEIYLELNQTSLTFKIVNSWSSGILARERTQNQEWKEIKKNLDGHYLNAHHLALHQQNDCIEVKLTLDLFPEIKNHGS